MIISNPRLSSCTGTKGAALTLRAGVAPANSTSMRS